MSPFLFIATVHMDTISHRYRLVSATLVCRITSSKLLLRSLWCILCLKKYEMYIVQIGKVVKAFVLFFIVVGVFVKV